MNKPHRCIGSRVQSMGKKVVARSPEIRALGVRAKSWKIYAHLHQVVSSLNTCLYKMKDSLQIFLLLFNYGKYLVNATPGPDIFLARLENRCCPSHLTEALLVSE